MDFQESKINNCKCGGKPLWNIQIRSTYITNCKIIKDQKIFYSLKCSSCGVESELSQNQSYVVEAWNNSIKHKIKILMRQMGYEI